MLINKKRRRDSEISDPGRPRKKSPNANSGIRSSIIEIEKEINDLEESKQS